MDIPIQFAGKLQFDTETYEKLKQTQRLQKIQKLMEPNRQRIEGGLSEHLTVAIETNDYHTRRYHPGEQDTATIIFYDKATNRYQYDYVTRSNFVDPKEIRTLRSLYQITRSLFGESVTGFTKRVMKAAEAMNKKMQG